jgi:ribose transport system substrate-binding protein
MRFSQVAVGAAAVALSAALAACGSSHPATAGAGQASSPTAAAGGATPAGSPDAVKATSAVAASSGVPQLAGSLGTALPHPADLSGKTVYYIPLSLQVSAFTNQLAGLKDALSKVGATVKSCDGQFSPTGVAQCINQAVGARASAVVTSSVSYTMASTAFAQLAKAGIPALLAGTEPAAGAPSDIHFISSTWYQVPEAQLAAQAVIADSGGKANVLYLRQTDNATALKMANAGIDEIKSACSGCTVTTVDVQAPQVTQAASIVSGALLKNPSINYVVPETDNWASGAVTGVQNANATSRVKVASTTGVLGSLQLLKSSPLFIADAGTSARYVGWALADAAIRMMSGQATPTSYPPLIRIFTKANIGSLDLTPAAETSGAWYGSPAAYTAGFEKFWGVA